MIHKVRDGDAEEGEVELTGHVDHLGHQPHAELHQLSFGGVPETPLVKVK